MISLPPSEFTFAKYNGMDLPYATICSTDTYIAALMREHIIGYCDGGEIEIRPRLDDMAVMFEDDDWNQFWGHVSKDVWIGIYFKGKKL